jgi:hypothetical protein
LGALYDIGVVDVRHGEELMPALADSIAAGGVQIVRACSERHVNVHRHHAVLRAVQEAFTR